jgi:hypothetical protein
MKFDLITVSCSSSVELIDMTQRCIDSARQDDIDLNVIVVETCKQTDYNADQIVMYDGAFCYNRALNLGLTQAKGDIHILANNDLIFHKGWSAIGEAMIINKFPSACALSQDHRQKTFRRGDWIYEGYAIGTYLPGWCIFLTKEGLRTIGGKLWDDVDFWYSDNLYADQLMEYGVRHGLFCNVQVDHITSMTLRSTSPSHQRKMAHESQVKYSIFRRNAKRTRN